MRLTNVALALRAAALLGGIAFPAFGQQRQTEPPFKWSGRIAPGRWIRVYDLNGRISVGAASGDNVEVTATKQWRRGDPATVRFETKKFGPGDESVVICAMWDDRGTCDERGYESHRRDRGDRGDRGMHDNDVSVEFHVLVPKGVKVGVNTVNGAVTVDGATSDVDASTVNGEVDVTTGGGRVNASNVNGGVRARLARVESDGTMDFTTVNGTVTVEVPADFGGDLEVQTVNGSLNTNFELTVSGRMDPHHLRGHVGRPGGPRLRLETVNGNVELRRR